LWTPLDIAEVVMTLFAVWTSNDISNWNGNDWSDYLTSAQDNSTYDSLKDANGDLTLSSTALGVAKSFFVGNNSAVQIGTEAIASYFVSMEDFFCGNLDITNINIFEASGTTTSVVGSIRQIVADWYYALRNLAAIGLLCGIIYTGIRILLSSIADDKAHYKEMLIDWFKAAALVIFIHVLMIIILHFCDIIRDILLDGSNAKYGILPYVRAQLASSWKVNQVGYLILYAILVYYTFIFGIAYIKRFFYTMLLIVIAPIVSLMYAFGHYGKGVFDRWLKEFVSNAFLQPYHLLIYSILFGWIASLLANAGSDIFVVILACIIAHFIRDAEKYYRMIFGINGVAAGKGSFESGEKTVKDVQHKVVEVVKTVAQVAAAGVGVGGLVSGAASAATKGAANTAAGQAGKMAGTANKASSLANGIEPGGNSLSSVGDGKRPLLPGGGGEGLQASQETPGENLNGGSTQVIGGNEENNNLGIEVGNNESEINSEKVESNNIEKIETDTVEGGNVDGAENVKIDSKSVTSDGKGENNNAQISVNNADVKLGNANMSGQGEGLNLKLDASAIEGAVKNIQLDGEKSPKDGLEKLNAQDRAKADALGNLGKSLGLGSALGNIYIEQVQSKQFKPDNELSTKERMEKKILQADMLLNGNDQSRSNDEPVSKNKVRNDDKPDNNVNEQSNVNNSTIAIDGKGLSKEIESAIANGLGDSGSKKIDVDAKVVGEAVSKNINVDEVVSSTTKKSTSTGSSTEIEAQSSQQVKGKERKSVSEQSAPKPKEIGNSSSNKK
jgi:hypothetical protein